MEQAATRTAEEEEEEEMVEKERGSGKVLFLLSFCVLLLSVSIFCNFCLHTLIRVGLLDYTPPPSPTAAAAPPLTAHWTYTGTHRAEAERESERERERDGDASDYCPVQRNVLSTSGQLYHTSLHTPHSREREREKYNN